jgi:hypothetical protein
MMESWKNPVEVIQKPLDVDNLRVERFSFVNKDVSPGFSISTAENGMRICDELSSLAMP